MSPSSDSKTPYEQGWEVYTQYCKGRECGYCRHRNGPLEVCLMCESDDEDGYLRHGKFQTMTIPDIVSYNPMTGRETRFDWPPIGDWPAYVKESDD